MTYDESVIYEIEHGSDFPEKCKGCFPEPERVDNILCDWCYGFAD
jgi:hypothetical protein